MILVNQNNTLIYKEKIYRMKHNDCFSKNSPFGYLINKKSKLLFVNIDFKKT